MRRREQIIWAAGFFDGEGCISVIERKLAGLHHYSLQMTAYQNVRAPLEVLLALFGGSLNRRDQGWIWLLTGPLTIRAMTEMAPFLLVKRAQAEAAIVFQRRKVKRGGKYKDPAHAKALDRQDCIKIRALKIVSNTGGQCE